MTADFDDSGGTSSGTKWALFVLALFVLALIVTTTAYCVWKVLRARSRDDRAAEAARLKALEDDGPGGWREEGVLRRRAQLPFTRVLVLALNGVSDAHVASVVAEQAADRAAAARRGEGGDDDGVVGAVGGGAPAEEQQQQQTQRSALDLTNTLVLKHAIGVLDESCGFKQVREGKQRRQKERRRRRLAGEDVGSVASSDDDDGVGAGEEEEWDGIGTCSVPYNCTLSQLWELKQVVKRFAGGIRKGERALLVVLDGDLLMPFRHDHAGWGGGDAGGGKRSSKAEGAAAGSDDGWSDGFSDLYSVDGSPRKSGGGAGRSSRKQVSGVGDAGGGGGGGPYDDEDEAEAAARFAEALEIVLEDSDEGDAGGRRGGKRGSRRRKRGEGGIHGAKSSSEEEEEEEEAAAAAEGVPTHVLHYHERRREARAERRVAAAAAERRRRTAIEGAPGRLGCDEARNAVERVVGLELVAKGVAVRRDAALCIVHDCHPAVTLGYGFLPAVRSRLVAAPRRAGDAGGNCRYAETHVAAAEDAGAAAKPGCELVLVRQLEGRHDLFTPGALFLAFTATLRGSLDDGVRRLGARRRLQAARRRLARARLEASDGKGSKKRVAEAEKALNAALAAAAAADVGGVAVAGEGGEEEVEVEGEEGRSVQQQQQQKVPSYARFLTRMANEVAEGTCDGGCSVQLQSRRRFGPAEPVRLLQRYVDALGGGDGVVGGDGGASERPGAARRPGAAVQATRRGIEVMPASGPFPNVSWPVEEAGQTGLRRANPLADDGDGSGDNPIDGMFGGPRQRQPSQRAWMLQRDEAAALEKGVRVVPVAAAAAAAAATPQWQRTPRDARAVAARPRVGRREGVGGGEDAAGAGAVGTQPPLQPGPSRHRSWMVR